MSGDTVAASLTRVRVAELRPGDVLAGSSRTVVTHPGRDARTRRRHVNVVVRSEQGHTRTVTWRGDTLVYVRRPIDLPPPRRDVDG